nr:fibrinopeptide A [Rattus norvegicus]
ADTGTTSEFIDEGAGIR